MSLHMVLRVFSDNFVSKERRIVQNLDELAIVVPREDLLVLGHTHKDFLQILVEGLEKGILFSFLGGESYFPFNISVIVFGVLRFYETWQIIEFHDVSKKWVFKTQGDTLRAFLASLFKPVLEVSFHLL